MALYTLPFQMQLLLSTNSAVDSKTWMSSKTETENVDHVLFFCKWPLIIYEIYSDLWGIIARNSHDLQTIPLTLPDSGIRDETLILASSVMIHQIHSWNTKNLPTNGKSICHNTKSYCKSYYRIKFSTTLARIISCFTVLFHKTRGIE